MNLAVRPEQAAGWWAMEKRSSAIYTDDLGETWHISPGCQMPAFSWIQWEPTVWEQPDGSAMMFARTNTNWSMGHPKPASGQFLLWWSVETVARRGGPIVYRPMVSR